MYDTTIYIYILDATFSLSIYLYIYHDIIFIIWTRHKDEKEKYIKKTQKLTKKKHTHEMASVNFDVETRTTPECPTGSNPISIVPVDFCDFVLFLISLNFRFILSCFLNLHTSNCKEKEFWKTLDEMFLTWKVKIYKRKTKNNKKIWFHLN